MEYDLAIKRNELETFVKAHTPRPFYTGGSKSEREKQISYISAYIWYREK